MFSTERVEVLKQRVIDVCTERLADPELHAQADQTRRSGSLIGRFGKRLRLEACDRLRERGEADRTGLTKHCGVGPRRNQIARITTVAHARFRADPHDDGWSQRMADGPIARHPREPGCRRLPAEQSGSVRTSASGMSFRTISREW